MAIYLKTPLRSCDLWTLLHWNEEHYQQTLAIFTLYYRDELLNDKLLMSLLIAVQSQHFMFIKNPSTKEFYVVFTLKRQSYVRDTNACT